MISKTANLATIVQQETFENEPYVLEDFPDPEADDLPGHFELE